MKRKPAQHGEIKIEDGIPVSPRGSNSKGYAVVIRRLKPGQSAFFPGMRRLGASNAAQSALGAGNYATRREGDGYRVWRIK